MNYGVAPTESTGGASGTRAIGDEWGAGIAGVTRIGRIVAGQGVAILDTAGAPLEVQTPGYRHF